MAFLQGRLLLFLSVVLLALAPSVVFSQTAEPRRVAVDPFRVDDQTGKMLVYQFKEQIRESEGYQLAPLSSSSLVIQIQTMPKSQVAPRQSTVYEVLWTIPSGKVLPHFLGSQLGVSGQDKVESTARDLMAKTDRLVGELQKALNRSP